MRVPPAFPMRDDGQLGRAEFYRRSVLRCGQLSNEFGRIVSYTLRVRVLLLYLWPWLILWILLTIATRSFHPTLPIAAVATAWLELGSATALYVNEFSLVPRFARQRRWFAYACALVLTLCTTTLVVVLSIQLFYDILWGPDPRRLGLRANFASDFVWITLHVAIGAGIFGLIRRSPVQ